MTPRQIDNTRSSLIQKYIKDILKCPLLRQLCTIRKKYTNVQYIYIYIYIDI